MSEGSEGSEVQVVERREVKGERERGRRMKGGECGLDGRWMSERECVRILREGEVRGGREEEKG